jgi:hypothetical protein
MSVLVPEQRPDKNGHLVTRHVRADKPSGVNASSIPAPLLATPPAPARREYKELEHGELVALTEERFSELGITMEPNLSKILRQISYYNGSCADAAEAFYNLLPDIDAQGVESLTDGISAMRLSDSNFSPGPEAEVFSMAVKAYAFSREVDDATLPVPNALVTKKTGIYRTAIKLFWDKKRISSTPENTADLEAHYFMQSLGLSADSFPSAGDYYRGINKLNEQRDELKPYLPLLIALNTAFTNGKGFYFNDDYYLWENIEMVKQYPVDRIEAIARETIRRGGFDESFAEEVANSNADTLNEGLL